MAHQPDYHVHPAADLFPMMGQAEVELLGHDIAKNGQRFPIQLWNGTLVDGRNRLAACRSVGISETVEEVDFASEAKCVSFIISNNIHRRHLTDEQRDQIGARLVTMQQGDNQWSPQNAGTKVGVAAAAALVHSTPARIERARTIERADPALAEQVIKGEISKGKAMKEIKARERTKPTDPDRADDKVVDATAEAHADGYTKKMETVWSAYWKLDETEQTAFHERQKEKGMIK